MGRPNDLTESMTRRSTGRSMAGWGPGSRSERVILSNVACNARWFFIDGASGGRRSEWEALGPTLFYVGMKRQDITTQVEELLQPIATRMGLETVDVELHGTIERTVLRVLMDRPEGGITVEECARVSEALSRQLDLYDLFAHTYTLEVSSPGLDRPLRTDGEYRRFAGRRAEVATHDAIDGQRRCRGTILGVGGDSVV